MNCNDVLFENKESFLEHTALIDNYSGYTATYAQLQQHVRNVAAGLENMGLIRGDVVAIHLYNGAEAVIVHLGIQYAGMTSCMIDPLNPATSLEYYLTDASARCLCTHLADDKTRGMIPDGISVIRQDDIMGMANQTAPGDYPESPYSFDSDDVNCIYYTSGTTSLPKGVMLGPKNYFNLLNYAKASYPYKSQDRLLCFVPFSHGFGSMFILMPGLDAGAAIVMMRSFQPQKIAEAIEIYHITYIYGVPQNFQQLLRRKDLYRSLRKLKYAFCAAAKLEKDVIDAWKEYTGVTLDEGYGLIETCTAAVLRLGEKSLCTGHIGHCNPAYVTVDILDENNRVVPSGTTGEIAVRGDSVMTGYLNKPEANAEALQDGWFKTGDMGYKDDAGEIFMTGRIKDIINIAGIKISPYEIESVFNDYPGVVESAAIGVDDALYGEAVKAFIQTEPDKAVTENELIDFARERLMGFQLPRFLEFCDDFPRNNMGKVDKKQLREMSVSN